LRRLPKKLLTSFFQGDSFAVAADEQLVERIRQTDRWDLVKSKINNDVAGARSSQFQVNGAPRSFRDHAAASKTMDAQTNLEFLGRGHLCNKDLVGEKKNVSEAKPRGPVGRLTMEDLEYFSGSSAMFLGRLGKLEQDPSLVRRYRELGSTARETSAGQFGWLGTDVGVRPGVKRNPLEYSDPYAAKTDKVWSSMKDPFGLDFDELNFFETEKKEEASSPGDVMSPRTSTDPRKSSVKDVAKLGGAVRRMSRAAALSFQDGETNSERAPTEDESKQFTNIGLSSSEKSPTESPTKRRTVVFTD